MPDPASCTCGAHVTDPDALVTYVTDTLIEAVLDGVIGKLKYIGPLAPFIGTVVNVKSICDQPKPRMPEFSLADFAQIPVAFAKFSQMLHAKIYDLNCTCNECPPVSDCGTGTSIVITPENGYFPDNDQPGVKEYVIPYGSEIYAERSFDSACLGFKSGVIITWHVDDIFDPAHGMSVCDGAGHFCNAWSQDDAGSSVTLYVGGTPQPPREPVPEPPPGIDDWYGPPACTTDDLCVALQFVSDAVRRIEFLTTVIAGPMYGITTPISALIPGGSTPITGTLADYLARAIPALAPITNAQLVNEETTTVSVSSLIDVTGLAYINIQPTVVPPGIGSRGSAESEVYYSNHRTPGPGWVTLVGESGIVGHREILYPSGLEIVIPGTVQSIAVDLTPGTEVEVTTWQRSV